MDGLRTVNKQFFGSENYSRQNAVHAYASEFSIHISICSNKIYYNQFTYRWIVHVRFCEHLRTAHLMHTVYSFFGDIACPSFDRFSPIVRFKSHLYHHETLMLYNLSCWNVNFERFVGDSEHEHIEYSRYLCCDACFIFEIFAVLAPTHIDSWIFCAIFFLSCTPIFAE